MTREELTASTLYLLGRIAPEADLTTIQPSVNLRDQLDLDSMDVLNFIIALHETLGVEIPETDYGQLMTLAGCVDYLAHRLPQGDAPHDESNRT